MYVFKKKKQKTVPSAVDVDDAQRRKLVSYTWPYQLEERWLWRWPSSARFPPCSVQGKWSTTMALATAVVDLTVTVYDWRHDDVSWSGRKFYRLAYASRAHPVELEKCVNSDGHHHQRPNDVGSTNRYCLFFSCWSRWVARGRATYCFGNVILSSSSSPFLHISDNYTTTFRAIRTYTSLFYNRQAGGRLSMDQYASPTR